MHTYCNELLEHTNYIKYLEAAKKAQFKFTVAAGFGGGVIFWAILNLYATAFWFGGYLRIEKVTEGEGENEKIYSGG